MKDKKHPIKRVLVLISCFLSLFVHGQNLEILIQEAFKNNPEIQNAETVYKSALEKKNEVNSLANTEFGLGYFASEPETRTGAQRFRVSVKQMIPWFGSITARENYVSSMADAKYEDIAIAKRKLIVSVS